MNFKHADCFADGVNRDFIREFVGAMALEGRVRIFELVIAGEVVATRLAFLEGRELYFYYSGYDPAWRKYSVMTTLMAEIMRWSISRRFAAVSGRRRERDSILALSHIAQARHSGVTAWPALGRAADPGILPFPN